MATITLLNGFQEVYADFLFVEQAGGKEKLVLASVFKRGTELRAFTAGSQGKTIRMKKAYASKSVYVGSTDNYICARNSDAELVSHAVMQLQDDYLLYCTKDNYLEVLYDYLMNTFDLPLMKEWIADIYNVALYERYLTNNITLYHSDNGTNTIHMYNQDVPLNDILIYRSNITLEWLSGTIKKLFEEGVISISEKKQKKLDIFNDEKVSLDTYFQKYGHTVISNLNKELIPICPDKPIVSELALKEKKPFPKQGIAINGVVELLQRSKYAILNEGMGCGKSLQAAAIAEAYHVKKWLNTNPGKTVKDAYMDPAAISYNCIVMCPGHLVEKWKKEIENQIPYSEVTILHKFKDVTNIKRERNGKQFYVASKDFLKLGSTQKPVPYRVGKKNTFSFQCEKCETMWNSFDLKKKKCECRSKRFRKIYETDTFVTGLLCPDCDEVLLSPSEEGLTPIDFSSKHAWNSCCPHCGTMLWTQDVSNLNGQDRPSKWHKISHFTNKTKKTKSTAWVLNGYEGSYARSKEIKTTEIVEAVQAKTRKTSPAEYIKRHLRGCFDFCILDELHMYKGGGTAQGTGMHALIKASKKVLGLTGTIAGGYAEDLFYLLFRLDPKRMLERGFRFNGVQKFAGTYGTTETTFQINSSGAYNKSSRGRQLSSPKSKPGISPLIFGDFLIDKCVFLDITDMSKYIPTLTEEIVLVEPDFSVFSEYNSVISSLKNQGNNMLNPLASAMLQFSMSYLDKPYGYGSIVHPKTGAIVSTPFDFSSKQLLPKEEKLVELINQEQAEGRNVFVYAEFTGQANTKVTTRLKQIIEENCRLKGAVAILESTSPKADKREAWLQNQAQQGKKVIISNPKCVETGLDFIFTGEDGEIYTYPTIIYYQMGYNLFTLWQASRRHFRLNQKKDCRTYYMAYEGTVQQTILEVMASKQVATSAIQGGKFSAEGLSAMANGVDARLKMIQALSENDFNLDNADELKNKFNLLNQCEEDDDGELFDFSQVLTFQELIGEPIDSFCIETQESDTLINTFLSMCTSKTTNTLDVKEETKTVQTVKKTSRTKKPKFLEGQLSLWDLF